MAVKGRRETMVNVANSKPTVQGVVLAMPSVKLPEKTISYKSTLPCQLACPRHLCSEATLQRLARRWSGETPYVSESLQSLTTPGEVAACGNVSAPPAGSETACKSTTDIPLKPEQDEEIVDRIAWTIVIDLGGISTVALVDPGATESLVTEDYYLR